MIKIIFHPLSNSTYSDAKLEEAAEHILYTDHETAPFISQVVMIDALRYVMMRDGIAHDSVEFDVYDEQNNFLETLVLSDKFQFSTWKSFPSHHLKFLRFIMTGKRDDKEQQSE